LPGIEVLALICIVWMFVVMIRYAKRAAEEDSREEGSRWAYSAPVVLAHVAGQYNFYDSEGLLLVLSWFSILLFA
jgi:hypothetical protein